MMQHIDDIFVAAGVLLLGIGIYFHSGLLTVVFYAGIVCLIAGGIIATRVNGR